MAATPTIASRLNTNLGQYGLPSMTPRFMAETLIISGLTGMIGSLLGKLVDEHYPKADKSKSMVQSMVETYIQIGLLGLLLYVGKQSVSWIVTRVYTTNNDPFIYANIVMGLAMITVQKNLQTKLLNL